ncbi:hypothetical protein CBS147339_7257 [Penicillium roqueforti]|nr:hypothetical protein DTO012A8_9276 [Penicillium roqueforti]KAI3070770.1 hypothetical protein CBS147339_7257 [Penicillium roqueforti]KAI3089677.1 hypothetical protein CBS147338_9496 [Penicillium roqueforti]KAI3184215.1 hypothetical protein DTO032C6_6404 [Penicillium roqueforti]KAI3223214.1 hypothetical protein CBS147310_9585 [Penicillium roqueforti]
MHCTQADIDSYNALSAFVQQQDMIMGNDGFESKACPESSRVSSMTELYRGGYDQADALLSSSSSCPQGPGEIETISHTDEALSVTLKRFTSTINQFGALSQTLGNKIEGLNSRFDDMERRLDSMENRMDSMKQSMDSMKHSMDNLSQETESLEAKFKSVNEYLLEVIRREQRVMKEFSDLASRYQEQEI